MAQACPLAAFGQSDPSLAPFSPSRRVGDFCPLQELLASDSGRRRQSGRRERYRNYAIAFLIAQSASTLAFIVCPKHTQKRDQRDRALFVLTSHKAHSESGLATAYCLASRLQALTKGRLILTLVRRPQSRVHLSSSLITIASTSTLLAKHTHLLVLLHA